MPFPWFSFLGAFVFFGSLAVMDTWFRPGHAQIVIQSGDRTSSFYVDVAWSPEAQARGLMFRKDVDHASGMFFPSDKPRRVSLWMKDTYVPLDMLFLDARGRVVKVVRRASPMSLTKQDSGQFVYGVIEILGGVSEDLGISEGSFVKSIKFD